MKANILFFSSSVMLACLCLPAGAARGDRVGGVDPQVVDAQRLYLAHDYAGAVQQLEAAYRRKPVARLLFNLGMSHRKLGNLEQALDYFERYRRARAKSDASVPVEEYIENVRAELAERARQAGAAAELTAAQGDVRLSRAQATVERTTPPPAETGAPTAAVVPMPSRMESSRAPLTAMTLSVPSRPRQRRWWPWAVASGAVVVTSAVVVGLAVGLTTSSHSPAFAHTLGEGGPGAMR